MTFLRRLLSIVIGVVCLIVGYVVTSVWRAEVGSATPVSAKNAAATKRPAVAPVNPFANGSYLVAYVLFASDCGFSELPGSKDAISRLRATLLKSQGASFAAVRVVAVDLDKDVKPGLDFISQLQHGATAPVFDQVEVGGSWLNEEFVRLGWQKGMAKPAIPQVVLVTRPVDSRTYLSNAHLSVGADSVLADIVGAADIAAWVAGGTRIDAGAPHHP
jgi:hypothetical protein